MNLRSAIAQARWERRDFEDELDVIKRRRYLPCERTMFDITLMASILKRRYGGPWYEQNYQQETTLRGIQAMQQRRNRIFGTPSEDEDVIIRRVGFVKHHKVRKFETLMYAMGSK